jgi:phage-related protein
MLLNGTLAISPLGWVAIVIGGLIGVGVALWQNWDSICAKASELWTSITTAFNGICSSVTGAFDGMGSAISGFINYAIGGINSLIDGLNSLASFTLPDWLPEVGGKSFSLNMPHVPNFATGTQYFKGGLAEMNEHGGEMAIMPNGSKVIPSDKTDKLLNGSGALPNINVIIQGNVIGNHDFANEMGQIITNKVKLALINV